MYDLKELSKTDTWTRSLCNRALRNLSMSEARWVLSHMGAVMSLRKIHKKVAVMTAILIEMDIGDSLLASDIVVRANKYVTTACSLNPSVVGSLMRYMIEWGYVETEINQKYGTRLYKRVK